MGHRHRSKGDHQVAKHKEQEDDSNRGAVSSRVAEADKAEDEAEDVAEDEGEEAMAKVAKAKEEALQFLQGEG